MFGEYGQFQRTRVVNIASFKERLVNMGNFGERDGEHGQFHRENR